MEYYNYIKTVSVILLNKLANVYLNLITLEAHKTNFIKKRFNMRHYLDSLYISKSDFTNLSSFLIV